MSSYQIISECMWLGVYAANVLYSMVYVLFFKENEVLCEKLLSVPHSYLTSTLPAPYQCATGIRISSKYQILHHSSQVAYEHKDWVNGDTQNKISKTECLHKIVTARYFNMLIYGQQIGDSMAKACCKALGVDLRPSKIPRFKSGKNFFWADTFPKFNTAATF